MNQELLKIMIVLPSGETLVWKAIDISGQRERTIDVMPHIKEMLHDLKNQSIKVTAIVSDSASAIHETEIKTQKSKYYGKKGLKSKLGRN